MKLVDLITLLEKKLVHLGQLKQTASSIGDVEQVSNIEVLEVETNGLLSQLRSTLNVTD